MWMVKRENDKIKLDMKRWKRLVAGITISMLIPCVSQAQALSEEIGGLQSILSQLYDEMMPLCSKLIGVAQGIAGFASLWYIASRVWRHLAAAEPIDFYPLFRPFVIGFCIMIFPYILGMINGIMKPTVTATAGMVKNSDKAIEVLLKQKEDAIKSSDPWKMYVGITGNGDRDRWYKYTHEDSDPAKEGFFEGIGNDIKFAMSKASYSFRNSVKQWMSEVLSVLFQAAALCIDTLRTFQLVVLSILGPLVFGLAVFDGFQHTLTVWLARYINIFLWLPVANIFGAILGKIQEKMIELDIGQIQQSGDTFFSTKDTAYLVFMIIGIIGYFSVPSIANYIVHAGGGGALGRKATSLFHSSSKAIANAATGGTAMAADMMGNAASKMSDSMASFSQSTPYFNDKTDPKSGYMADRLKGNS